MTPPVASPASSHAARLHGHDTLRALAIAVVVCYHYEIFVSGRATFGLVSELGWAGVDLFFVLSGYLIGQQVLAPLIAGQPFGLKRFFQRRLLRTLPNYLVVLALYLAWPTLMGGVPRTPVWRFLTFTQNFGLLPGSAFSHAWSLCVEEQFYLLMPAAMLLAAATGRVRGAGWALLCGLVLSCTVVRAWLWQRYGGAPVSYMTHIYYASIARFDEFVPGLALALWRRGHPDSWARATRHGNTWLAAGLSLCGLVLWQFLTHDEGPDGSRALATTVFGYPLLAMGFGLLTLAALSEGSLLQRVRIPGAQALAIGSYGLYLIHKPVFACLRTALDGIGIARDSALAVPIQLVAALLAGWALYRGVETPFMRWRERRFPSTRTATTLRPYPAFAASTPP